MTAVLLMGCSSFFQTNDEVSTTCQHVSIILIVLFDLILQALLSVINIIYIYIIYNNYHWEHIELNIYAMHIVIYVCC